VAKDTPLTREERERFGVCVAHRNVRDAQRGSHDQQLQTLKEGECLWGLDYGQSKSIKMKPEEDSFDFFNKNGISVIGNVCFFKHADALYKKVFCFYSVHTTHTAQSSIDYFDRVLDYDVFKTVKKIFMWSDGGGHFKNNDFVIHLLQKSTERDIEIQYNNFCEYEGKDACDQFFGSLTNGLERHTKLKPILDVNDLLDFSQQYFKKNATNEYTFEIYHPIRCMREENTRAIDGFDDFLSFNMANGEITAAVLTAGPHLPVHFKKKPGVDGPIVYPAGDIAPEDETDKEKRKRKKKENF
jgi:hypothetical protein